MSDDAEVVMPGGMVFRGPAETRPMLEAYVNAFPGLRHEVVSAIETADSIAVELRITMTHTGVFATPMGELPPTGNRVVLEACDVVRFDRDGKIRSWHAYFDSASMMAQLGVMPTPA
jgi:predicted ester cyclase